MATLVRINYQFTITTNTKLDKTEIDILLVVQLLTYIPLI